MSKKLIPVLAILCSLLCMSAFGSAALATPLNQCFNVVTLGADPSGQTASDTAFNNAISQAANSTSPCVYIPGGHFHLTSTLTYSFSNQASGISIFGAGEAVTYLDFTGVSGGGIYFKYPNGPAQTHIRDFTITTNGSGANGSAITLERDDSPTHPATLLNSGSDISYVNFIGTVGCAAGGYWATGVDIKGFNNVDFIGDYYCGSSGSNPAGVAYKLEQSPNSISGIGYNFLNITANFGAIGIEYGVNVQGVQIVNGNFGTSYGVYVDPGAPGDQLAISNSQFGGYFIAAIKDNAGILNTIINGNTFDGNSGGVAIDITGMTVAAITNNIFTNVPGSSPSTYGILIRSTKFSFGNYIGENNFNNQGGAGILIQAGASGIVVGPEAYGSGSYANGVNITDNGAGDTVWAPTPGAWTPFSPTVSAVVGTLSSYSVNSARYVVIGKTVEASYDISFSNIGSAGAAIVVTLPVPSKSSFATLGFGRDEAGGVSTSGIMDSASAYGTGSAQVVTATNGFPVANGSRLTLQLTYETP